METSSLPKIFVTSILNRLWRKRDSEVWAQIDGHINSKETRFQRQEVGRDV